VCRSDLHTVCRSDLHTAYTLHTTPYTLHICGLFSLIRNSTKMRCLRGGVL